MDIHQYLKKIPKISLHCHMEGSMRATTLVELANKHGVTLPPYEEPSDLYKFNSIDQFFHAYTLACQSLRDIEDFQRLAYECIQDEKENNLRYREMFWSPAAHTAMGVPYKTALDGTLAGLKEAEDDFHIPCRLISDIPLFANSTEAIDLMEEWLGYRKEEIIGVGFDYGEKGNPPQKFKEALKMAKLAGLHQCGHTGQIMPAEYIEICLDELGCERIDHGYTIMDDMRIVERCKKQGVLFTVTPTSTQMLYFHDDLSLHPIHQMIESGLKVMLDTDDPTLCSTNLTLEYQRVADQMGYGPQDFKNFVLNGLDGSWLDDATKREWRNSMESEIDSLIHQISQ